MKQRTLVFWVVLVSLFLASPAWAQSVVLPDLFKFTTARSDLTWTLTSGEQEQIITGVFITQPPTSFQFIPADQGQRIIQDHSIGIIQKSNRSDYYYDPHQLFSLFSDFYLPLVSLREFEGEYVGEGLDGSRAVEKYILPSDSGLEYWFEEETTLPWRVITEEGEDFLATTSYHLGDVGEISQVEWELHAKDYEATIVLRQQGGSWFPRSIEIRDESLSIRAQHGDWEVLDTPIDLGGLPRLNDLLVQGSVAYDQKDWPALIDVYYVVGEIDPYYLAAYFYRGYGYGMIGNYLGAIENYQQWLMMQPLNPLALNNLAYTYMQQEIRLEEALDLARRAVQIQNHAAYLDTLGYGHYLLGNYEQALDYLNASLEGIEEDMLPEVIGHLIQVHQALGNDEQVTKYREKLQDE